MAVVVHVHLHAPPSSVASPNRPLNLAMALPHPRAPAYPPSRPLPACTYHLARHQHRLAGGKRGVCGGHIQSGARRRPPRTTSLAAVQFIRLGRLLGCFSGFSSINRACSPVRTITYSGTLNFLLLIHLEVLILTQQPVRIQYLQVCVEVDVGGFSTLTNFRVVDMGWARSQQNDNGSLTGSARVV